MNWLTAVLFVAVALLAVVAHKLVLHKVEDWFQEKGIPTWIRFYEKQLRWALDHRVVVLAGSGAALVLTVMAFGVFNNGVEFFP